MPVTEIKRDLFASESPLAHCVSKDFSMGKGIAVLFKDKFGTVSQTYRQGKNIGDIVVIDRQLPQNKYIFHMITKEHYYDKPTYKTLTLCLEKLYQKCKELNINDISMPKIGCGLDRLEWNKVKIILEKIFTDINVVVHLI